MVVSGLAQLFLLANLENPTFRKSLITAKRVLEKYDLLSEYRVLLQVLGSQEMAKPEVEACFESCLCSFDKSVEVHTTRFFGDRNIKRDLKRSILDAGKSLIAVGHHKEAMLWIMDTHAAFGIAIENDGTSDDRKNYRERIGQTLSKLGIKSDADYERLKEHISVILPQLLAHVRDVISRNPLLVDSL